MGDHDDPPSRSELADRLEKLEENVYPDRRQVLMAGGAIGALGIFGRDLAGGSGDEPSMEASTSTIQTSSPAPYPVVVSKGRSGKIHAESPGGQIDCGTDATSVIESAIAALPAGGGTVLIQNGTYTLPSPITITKSGVVVRGQSWNTELRAASGLDGDMVRVGDGGSTKVTGVVFRDLCLAGNSDVETGIHFTSQVWYCRVRNSSIMDVRGDGIRLTSTDGFCVWHVIEGCKIENAGRDGVNLVGRKTRDNFINNCAIRSNGRIGVNAGDPGQNWNHFYQIGFLGNGEAGIAIGGRYTNVEGCHFEFNQQGGIRMTSCQHSAVVGNTFRENSRGSPGDHPEILANGSYSTVVANSGYAPESLSAIAKIRGDKDVMAANTFEGAGYTDDSANSIQELNI